MYLDTLDTIRFNKKYYENAKYSHSFAKASIMSNLLLGNRIVLSQSQLLDSKFILESIGDAGFRRLIEDRYINTSLYKYEHNTPFTQHLANRIKSEGFLFSHIDDDPKNQNEYRQNVISILEGRAHGSVCNDDNLIAIQYMSEFITSLERTRGYNHYIAIERREKLSDCLLCHISLVSDADEFESLKELISSASPQSKNNRAYYYKNVDSNQKRCKAIVDIYYNYILSLSVMGTNASFEITAYKDILTEADWNIFEDMCSTNAELIQVDYYAGESKIKTEWNEIYDYLEFLKNNQLGNYYFNLFRKYLLETGKIILSFGSDILMLMGGILNVENPAVELSIFGIQSVIEKFKGLSFGEQTVQKILDDLKTEIEIQKIQKLKNMKGKIKK